MLVGSSNDTVGQRNRTVLERINALRDVLRDKGWWILETERSERDMIARVARRHHQKI